MLYLNDDKPLPTDGCFVSFFKILRLPAGLPLYNNNRPTCMHPKLYTEEFLVSALNAGRPILPTPIRYLFTSAWCVMHVRFISPSVRSSVSTVSQFLYLRICVCARIFTYLPASLCVYLMSHASRHLICRLQAPINSTAI